MLEKLITSLKQSLPEPLRKKLGIVEETLEDEDSEDHSEEQSEESHDSTDNDADKKKKQISMIIRVAVVIGLGYLAIDQFVLKHDENMVADIPVKPRKPRKKPPVTDVAGTPAGTASKPGDVAPAVPAAEKNAADVAATPPSEPQVDTAKENLKETAPVVQPPVENINIAEKKEPPAPAPEETPPPVNEPVLGEVKSNSQQIDKSIDSLIDSVDGGEKKEADTTEKKEVKLEDKIVADDVYTPPPAYDQVGRGLVYNCKEKYWSCVDKLAYVNCNKNMKWNKAHTKPVECAVQNVYNSDDDCSVVQKYNISTSKATPFCQ